MTLSGLGLAAGLTATVRPDAATWFGVRGPRCPLGSCLGPIACPGCGLVRSTANTLQGEFSAAWATHPGGLGIALLLPTVFLVHLDILRRGHELPFHRRLRRAGYVFATLSIFAGWLIRFSH